VKVLLQRVNEASVSVDEKVVAEIGRGMVALVGIAKGDRERDARYLAGKVVALRIFPDGGGKLNLSVADMGGELLVVSQFTLLADVRRGNRPSFTDAAPPDEARDLFEQFVQMLRTSGLRVEIGCFQQHMLVKIHNDGPVTILLDSRARD
jgi:D-tyrosyl-tRNA(Tyr) deacylase